MIRVLCVECDEWQRNNLPLSFIHLCCVVWDVWSGIAFIAETPLDSMLNEAIVTSICFSPLYACALARLVRAESIVWVVFVLNQVLRVGLIVASIAGQTVDSNIAIVLLVGCIIWIALYSSIVLSRVIVSHLLYREFIP